ncbi:MAG: plasmid pRiA4b ORF-3 family protein [Pseudomonadales bacterium]|nr:plasmid pRiA4b ORF-3 family protein [Pseudomonadales bacterium]
MKNKPLIYQFKVTLTSVSPPVWRTIQVPADYSFWDLHVAIQDAMGWLDYHLHLFVFELPRKKRLNIGIPDDEYDEPPTSAGWEISIGDFYRTPGDLAVYEYDFGDGWTHELILEGIFLRDDAVRYPKCIAGERACPPEDCGGVTGYEQLLVILDDPSNEEYEDMKHWLTGHAKNYWPYKPDDFKPRKVKFDDPHVRWRNAFSNDDVH